MGNNWQFGRFGLELLKTPTYEIYWVYHGKLYAWRLKSQSK